MPFPRKQYVIVDKKHRRYSAPGYINNCRSPNGSQNLKHSYCWQRASTSDLSVLLDNQSESGSSLELDTSNLSRELSPTPTAKDIASESSRGSYQNLPVIHFEVYRQREEERSVWYSFCSWFAWKVVILSQLMAGCLALMDIINRLMRKQSRRVLGHCFINYVLLSLLWTTRLALRNDDRGILQVLKLCGLRYVLLSVLHVQANYFLFSSFQQDSYMGNHMIDLVAASLSVVLAFVCLEVQFQLTHVKGFAISFVGAIGFCITNVYSKTGEDEICWGDIFRIGSGIFLGLSNLAQELIVKSIDSTEYLGMIGLLGSLISGLQMLLLEGNDTLPLNSYYWFCIIIFSVFQSVFSCLMPRILRDVGTTGLHLSLISSEFYYYIFQWLTENEKFQVIQVICVISYGLVLFGSYLFAVKRTTIGTHYFFPVKVAMPRGV